MATKTDSPFSPLVAQILEASAAQTASVTNQVIDGLTERAATAEATVAAIRAGVLKLLASPYTPSPAVIEDALYPSDDLIALFRKEDGR